MVPLTAPATAPPGSEAEAISLPPPPEAADDDASSPGLLTALPVVGSVGSVLVVASSGGEARTRALVAAALFLLASVGVVVLQADRQRRRRLRQAGDRRVEHLRHLERARVALEVASRERAARLDRAHPPPRAIALGAAVPATGAAAARRRDGDAADVTGARPDLAVRWGTTAGPPAVRLSAPEERPARPDPFCTRALDRLLAHPEMTPDVPAVLHLTALRQVVLVGPDRARRGLARALVVSAAAAHPPDVLSVTCWHDGSTAPEWEWLAWLPHAGSARCADAVGPARLVADDLTELLHRLDPERGRTPDCRSGPGRPHLLLVVDTAAAPPGVLDLLDRADDVTVVRLDEAAAAADLVLEVAAPVDAAPVDAATAPGRAHRPGAAPVDACLDLCDAASARAAARVLAGRARRPAGGGVPGGPPDGEGQPTPNEAALPPAVLTASPAAHWRPHGRREPLRTVVGSGPDGPLVLDLEEPAAGGAGPHGLVVGTTGSGKSELLRTVVLGLAAGQPPEDLQAVLVDFKGGATFAGLGRLPHVAALLTNLAGDVALVDRAQAALEGEVLRRQEVLRAAGDLASVHEHEARRAAGAPLEPLPRLLVVVDEFAELLAARPDLLDLFVALGRLGRSLGIHLLLATQRLEEGRLRGLESHLSVRVALRTSTAAESRAVVGVPDAALLPTVPGLGLLRTGPDAPVPFRAGLVSRPRSTAQAAHPSGEPAPGAEDGADVGADGGAHPGRPLDVSAWVLPFGCGLVANPEPDGEVPHPAAEHAPTPLAGPDAHPAAHPAAHPGAETVLSASVAAMAEHARAAGHAPPHPVWLPPLEESPALCDLPGPPGDAGEGWVVPLGWVDLPREQRRDPLLLDLRGAGGHVAVVGGPRSGRSTALRTLVGALALRRSPAELAVLALDLTGGLAGLDGLPHLAARAVRADPDGVRRVVAHAAALADEREAADGSPGQSAPTRVLLVVDGWSVLREEHPDLEVELTALAARGLAVGVHLAVATHRWADLRPAVRDLLGSRLELRLGDPLDSLVGRRAAAAVPTDRPGRGLRGDGAHVLVALPSLGGSEADLVRSVAARWPGQRADGPAPLPDRVLLDDLAAATAAAPARDDGRDGRRPTTPVPLGLADDGRLVGLATERHLLVLGEPGSGRTSALRAALRGLLHQPPERLQVLLVDPRRTLLGEVARPHLLDDVTDAARTEAATRALADHLQARLPTAVTSPVDLRDRSWWSGPEVAVVVDDLDLLVDTRPGPPASPLAPLLPLLPRADEVGLRVLVARRAAGAARSPDPLPRLLREAGGAGLVLPARAEDGPLLGVATAPGPPGRGRWLGGDGRVRTVQVGWTAPAVPGPTAPSGPGRHRRAEPPGA